MELGITVITPTGGRPEAFALSELYMRQQTYTGPLQWIVVDDCYNSTTQYTMGQEVIRPVPYWTPGTNTHARNLRVALDQVRYSRIVHWEDDDYYSPSWLQICWDRLSGATKITAEQKTKYYNVAIRCWRPSANEKHGSLCQTAMTDDVIPIILAACKDGERFVDMKLWELAKDRVRWSLHGPSNQCIGIKSMPGRQGIGIGHKEFTRGWRSDPNLEVLTTWIGEEAAQRYAQYGYPDRIRDISIQGANTLPMPQLHI